MILLTSPAKTMLFTRPLPTNIEPSPPLFPHEVKKLITLVQTYSLQELQQRMRISIKLAQKNFERFQNWEHPKDKPRPALYTYAGDIFREMTPYTYTEKQRAYAQSSIYIISGLYGLVRPLDAIQAYRLEMNALIQLPQAKNLYEFWKSTLTSFLMQRIQQDKHDTIINLASSEYSDAIDFSRLPCKTTTIQFRQQVRGRIQNIGILSKRARGMMLEFAIKNNIQRIQDLKAFTTKGYRFKSQSENSLLFIQTP